MGSRLLPLVLALGALVADGAGLDRIASYLVLLAVVGAAGAAICCVSAVLAGQGSVLQAVTTSLALLFLVAGSVVRTAAPVGGRVPTFALSTLVLAVIAYAVPLLSWLLEPMVQRPRLRTDP